MVQQVAVAASDADLDDATNQLGQRLALSPDPVDESEAVPDLLISVLRLQCELLDDELSRRVSYLAEIRNALAGLRGLSPREMILAAPVVLSREFGFARTMISTVRRSIWLPQHLHIENEGDDPQSRRLREYLTGARSTWRTLLWRQNSSASDADCSCCLRSKTSARARKSSTCPATRVISPRRSPFRTGQLGCCMPTVRNPTES